METNVFANMSMTHLRPNAEMHNGRMMNDPREIVTICYPRVGHLQKDEGPVNAALPVNQDLRKVHLASPTKCAIIGGMMALVDLATTANISMMQSRDRPFESPMVREGPAISQKAGRHPECRQHRFSWRHSLQTIILIFLYPQR